METLDPKNADRVYTQLIHISDIHIRPTVRHQEFRDVFERLYENLRATINPLTTLIVITGDVFDHKVAITPESLKMGQDFLVALSSIATTILIAGNHDLKETDPSRLDTLTPTVHMIPNLHYLKTTGFYQIGDVVFAAQTLNDHGYLRAGDFQPTAVQKYIALYHGTINGAITDLGQVLMNTDAPAPAPAPKPKKGAKNKGKEPIPDAGPAEPAPPAPPSISRYRPKSDFDGFDATLLGDIHKMQNFAPRVMAYAGSLIQQCHSETLTGHGYLAWNITDKRNITFKHVSIPNDIGFVSITITDGVIQKMPETMPRQIYLSVKVSNTSRTIVDRLIKDNVKPLVDRIINQPNITNLSTQTIISEQLQSADIRSQNEYELLKTEVKLRYKEKYTDEIYQQFESMHRAYRAKLVDTDTEIKNSSVIWRPVKMEFKNMFIYGNNIVNTFNFENGITSIISNNATGKSSIINILMFALFKESSNSESSSHSDGVINADSTGGGYVKLQIQYGNEFYSIFRESSQTPNSDGLYTFAKDILTKLDGIDGKEIIKINGQDVKKNLKEMIGNESDFRMSSIINTQDKENDFILKSITERYEYLKKIFRIDDYDKLSNQCKDDLKKIKAKIDKNNEIIGCHHSTIQSMQTICEITDKSVSNDNIISTIAHLKTDLQLATDKLDVVKEQIHSKSAALQKEMNDSKESLKKAIAELKFVPSKDESWYVQELQQRSVRHKQLSGTIKPINPKSTSAKPIKSREECYIQSEILQKELKTDREKIKKLSSTVPSVILSGIDLQSRRDELSKQYHQISSEEIEQYEEYDFEQDVPTIPKTTDQMSLQIKLAEITNGLKMHPEQDESIHGTLDCEIVDIPSEIIKLESQKKQVQPEMLIDDKNPETLLSRIDERLVDNTHKQNELLKSTIVPENVDMYLEPFNQFIEQDCEKSKRRFKEIKKTIFNPILQLLRSIKSGTNDNKKLQDLRDEYAKLTQYRLVSSTAIEHNVLQASNKKHNTLIDNKIKYYKKKYHKYLAKEHKRISKELNSVMLYNKYRVAEAIRTRVDSNKQLDNEIANIDQNIDYKIYAETVLRIKTNEGLYASLIENIDWYITQDYIELESLTSSIAECNIAISYFNLTKNLEIKTKNEILTTEIAVLQETKTKLIVSIENLTNMLEENTKSLTRASIYSESKTHSTNETDKILESVSTLEKEYRFLKNYSDMIGKSGIPAKIINSLISSFTEYINEILSFTKYKIKINNTITETKAEKSKNKIEIYVINPNGGYVAASFASGYEKFMLRIAFKRAFNHFGYYSKSGLMICDEAMDCLDQENYDTKLPELMNLLKMDYRMIMLISQRILPDIVDTVIRIEHNKEKNYSRLV